MVQQIYEWSKEDGNLEPCAISVIACKLFDQEVFGAQCT
jgi:hypothetical protein